MSDRYSRIGIAVVVAAFAGTTSAHAVFATNGDFEAGDLSGWTYFPTFFDEGTGMGGPGSTSEFNLTTDAASGSFAGEVLNSDEGAAAVIKQANVGVGQIQSGDVITIQFSAKGDFGVGGVLFAEFFSEIDGGGTSSSVLLGGAPLAVNSSTFTDFTFTAVAGSDVSGGVTLQFAAVTGAVAGSFANVVIDNVSIVPAPGAAGLLTLAGLAATRRRR